MTLTALRRPPAARPAVPGWPAPQAVAGRPGRPDQRRILLAGLAASLLLHLLLLLVSPRFFRIGGPPARPAAAARLPQAPPGVRIYELVPRAPAVPAPSPPPAPSAEPERARAPGPATPARPGAGPAAGAPATPAPGPSTPAAPAAPGVAERLAPRIGDRRLWILPRDLPVLPKSDEEAARERIYARIEALNDSLRAEAAAALSARDWTIKTADGKRWGISSEGIHLGDITLPLPALAAPMGRREELGDRLREWSEIRGQADRARIRERFDERARAIRERKDRERREGQQKSSPNPEP